VERDFKLQMTVSIFKPKKGNNCNKLLPTTRVYGVYI